jgi:hypothetical protein
MADTLRKAKTPPIIDPHAIPETVCDGPFNVLYGWGRATITFTHVRPKAAPLFEKGEVQAEAIVRARIAFSWENLVALKKLLNDMIPDKPPEGGLAVSSGGNKLH